VQEAQLAIAHGASALGLVSAMPSGPGVIEEDLIRQIALSVPPPIATFLLTSLVDDALLVEQIRYTACSTVQLCDRTSPSARERIRRYAPAVRIVQVVHVTGPESLKEAKEAAQASDALLLDSGRSHGEHKELGGTGRAHDWSLSRKIVQAVKVPVFLAGGLQAANVREAFDRVRPFALDICTGLRTRDQLDPVKLQAFVEAWQA
jgi:phosphoribosylanthranilate isomerase